MEELLNNNRFVYLLGFLWGDGGVPKSGSVTLWIVKKDSLVVQEIIKGVIPFKIYKYQSKSGNRQPVESMIFEKNLKDFLVENNYLNKSLGAPSKILSIIPESLKHYFWRGYSDADGCFYNNPKKSGGTYSLAGSYDKDWSEEISLLKSLDIDNYTLRRYVHKTLGHKSSTIYFRTGREIRRFGEFLYKDEMFGLDRKFKKYLSSLVGTSQNGKYPGVSYEPGHGGINKWRVYFKGYLGRYSTEEEGREVRLKAKAAYEARKK